MLVFHVRLGRFGGRVAGVGERRLARSYSSSSPLATAADWIRVPMQRSCPLQPSCCCRTSRLRGVISLGESLGQLPPRFGHARKVTISRCPLRPSCQRPSRACSRFRRTRLAGSRFARACGTKDASSTSGFSTCVKCLHVSSEGVWLILGPVAEQYRVLGVDRFYLSVGGLYSAQATSDPLSLPDTTQTPTTIRSRRCSRGCERGQCSYTGSETVSLTVLSLQTVMLTTTRFRRSRGALSDYRTRYLLSNVRSED